MKSITINGRFLSRPMTGVDRYATEVILSIDELLNEGHPLASQYKWNLAAPKGARKLTLRHISQDSLPYLNGLLWEQLTLPAYSANSKLLNLCNSAPIFKRNQLVVIHDAATVRVPESYSRGFQAWYKMMIPSLLRFSRHIGTVSNFSRNELVEIYGTSKNISILTEGAEHLTKIDSDDSILKSKNLLDRPYVFAVGSMAPHKNFQTLVAAVEKLETPPFDVVIAGGTNPRIFSSASRELPTWVKHVGYVTDNQLKSLYANAYCFVFPSKYEGYGLPPTEAMALGCPVICARSASLPEVCGDAAVYFDAMAADQLATELVDFFNNADLGAVLRKKGLDNVKDRTWRRAALAIIDALGKD